MRWVSFISCVVKSGLSILKSLMWIPEISCVGSYGLEGIGRVVFFNSFGSTLAFLAEPFFLSNVFELLTA
uniref:Uncharacterized protein n=1 Tax=Lepeophtheirus salmonis TaxID=72036 RepID=A0A0K2T6J7_LEPSM